MFQATSWMEDTVLNRRFINAEIERLAKKGIDAEMKTMDCKGSRLGKTKICLMRNKVKITRNAQGVMKVKSLSGK